MSKKREPRQTDEVSDSDLLKPLDILKIGSDDDPCFGKLYDLTTDECKRCGDSELCAIAFAHNKTKERNKIEAVQKFKDIKPNNETIKKFIRIKNKKGLKGVKVVSLIMKKFGITKSEAKKIYKTTIK